MKWNTMEKRLSIIIGLLATFIYIIGIYWSLFLIILFFTSFAIFQKMLKGDEYTFSLFPSLYGLSESSVINENLMRFLKIKDKDENYYCFICEEKRCTKHEQEVKIDLYPQRKILVDQRINTLIKHCLDICLSDIKLLNDNIKLKNEVKRCICFIFASLIIRFSQKISPVEFICHSFIPLFIQHMTMFMKGKRRAKSALYIQTQVMEVYMKEGFYCDKNMLHLLIKACQHRILSPFILSNNALSVFSVELITNLLYLFSSLISNPYYFNSFIYYLLSDDNLENISPRSEDTKLEQLLDNFVETDDDQSVLGIGLKEIMNNEQFLFIFMQFLKEEGAVNLIQFLLSIDSLNTKLIKPDLSNEEKELLSSECLLLYQEYFDETSPDYINFDNIIKESLKTMDQVDDIVVKIIDPFYKAYDHVYQLLEKTYLPLFIQSSFYYKLIAGSRQYSWGSYENDEEETNSTCSQNAINSDTISLKKNLDNDFPEFEDHTDAKIKDMSCWKVLVDKVEKRNNNYFEDDDEDYLAYSIKVFDTKEDISWTVQRELDEFYVLQSKLRQFHGNIRGIDCQLSKRRTPLFSSSFSYACTLSNISFLEGRKAELQTFLESLLSNPSLKSSSLLNAFLNPTLSSDYQFNSSSVDFKRMIRNLNSSLALKGGQDLKTLLPFISTFVSSTENRNKFTDQEKNEEEVKEEIENYYEPDEIEEEEEETSKKYLRGSLYKYILYIMNKIYDLNENNSRSCYLLRFFEPLLKNIIEIFLKLLIYRKLKNFMEPNNLVMCLETLKQSLNEKIKQQHTEDEKYRKLREAETLQAIQEKVSIFPPLSDFCFQIYSCFQFHLLNQQFILMIFNSLAQKLFPELFQ